MYFFFTKNNISFLKYISSIKSVTVLFFSRDLENENQFTLFEYKNCNSGINIYCYDLLALFTAELGIFYWQWGYQIFVLQRVTHK